MSFATNQELNNAQIAAVLAVINNASHCLSSLEGDATTHDHSPKGEARVALEVTLMKACTRLDDILDEEARWKINKQDAQIHHETIALEQIKNLFLVNEMKAQEVFAAEFQKQVSLSRIMGASVKSLKTGVTVPAPAVETVKYKKHKNEKRKK